MSETTPKPLIVICPDCGGHLEVDAATGEVLAHRSARPEAPEKDFDKLLAGLDESKAHAESVFAREMEALGDRERLMEEKFRRALERVEEEDDGSPPPSPFDAE